MKYHVEDIEDQIIATLKADVIGLSGVTIRTHAGEVNIRTFQDAAMMQGFVNTLPFIFVQYQGKEPVIRDSPAAMYVMRLTFRLFTGAKSLRIKEQAQRSAYAMLRSEYDDLHGRAPLSTPQMLAGIQGLTGLLSGVSITTAGFNPQSPLMLGGADEKLIVNLPEICVYSSDYTIRLQA